MARLEVFIEAASRWSFDERLAFCMWLLEESRRLFDPTLLLSQPLYTRLVVPAVREWREQSPDDARPHLWLGMLRCDDPSLHLEHALRLDPSCELARVTLTQWILGDVEYNQHELPAFYIHDPRDDLVALDRADGLASDSAEQAWVEGVRREIADLRMRAEGWLAEHPLPGDFAIH